MASFLDDIGRFLGGLGQIVGEFPKQIQAIPEAIRLNGPTLAPRLEQFTDNYSRLASFLPFAPQMPQASPNHPFNTYIKSQMPKFEQSPVGALVAGKPDQFLPRLKQQSDITWGTPQAQRQFVDLVAGGFGAHGGVPLSTKNVGNSAKTTQSTAQGPFFNAKRVGVTPKIQEGIEQTIKGSANKIQDIVGDKLTFKEMKAQAQVSPELKRTFSREATEKLGAQALALRNKVADLAQLGLDDEKFQEALIRDKAFGQYLGRLFGQRRITSNPTEKTLFNSAIADILKKGFDPEDVIKAAKGVDFNDPKQLTSFYRKYLPATKEDWIDKVRYNSMLSSPLTQIVNVSGNAQGTGFMVPLQKTVEGPIDKVVSALTKRPRTRFTGEGAAYTKGYYSNLKPAFQKLFSVFQGNTLIDNPDTRMIPLTTGGFGRGVENVLDISSKAMEGMDQFFQTLTQGGLTASQKYRTSRGVKGSTNVTDEARNLLFKGELTEPGKGVISNAIGAGGNWVRAGTNSQNQTVRWLAKLTIPFVTTGTNLAKMGAEYNPVLGGVNMMGNTDKTGQAAKIAIGGVVTLIGGTFALADQLTFSEPNDQKRKNAFRAAGMQPYAIKIGDTWVQYSKMHPAIAFQLATVAALTEAVKEKRVTEDTGAVIAKGAWNSLQFIADQTYTKNVSDFTKTIGGDVEGVSRLASNYPSQFVPFRGFLSWINRAIDQYQRKPDTDATFLTQTFQQMAMQMPGLSQLVPERTDEAGDPIPNQNSLLNALSPFRITTEDPGKAATFATIQQDRQDRLREKDLATLSGIGGKAKKFSTKLPKGSKKGGLGKKPKLPTLVGIKRSQPASLRSPKVEKILAEARQRKGEPVKQLTQADIERLVKMVRQQGLT